MMTSVFKFLAAALLFMAVTHIAVVMIDAWAGTGPGCPGDPEWLGYCEQVLQ